MKVVDSLVVIMLVRDVVVLAVMMVTSRLDRPPPIVLHDAIVRGDCLDVSVSIDSEEAAMCVADGDLPLLVVVLCFTERDEKKGPATEGEDWIGLDWIGLDWIGDWIGDWIMRTSTHRSGSESQRETRHGVEQCHGRRWRACASCRR